MQPIAQGLNPPHREGVETGKQLHFLRMHGCHEIQGYYFSRPLPAERFRELLRRDERLMEKWRAVARQ